MRPGEILPAADRAVPRAEGGEPVAVRLTNQGRLPAQVGAYVRFDRLSRELRCEPEPPAGARLMLPAGSSFRVEPGATVEVRAAWT